MMQCFPGSQCVPIGTQQDEIGDFYIHLKDYPTRHRFIHLLEDATFSEQGPTCIGIAIRIDLAQFYTARSQVT